MTRASDLHDAAMERANLAFIARMRGDEVQARTLFEQAFALEVEGIAALEERERVEPWHSVLHRSAATLALDCERPRDAEKIAAKPSPKTPTPKSPRNYAMSSSRPSPACERPSQHQRKSPGAADDAAADEAEMFRVRVWAWTCSAP